MNTCKITRLRRGQLTVKRAGWIPPSTTQEDMLARLLDGLGVEYSRSPCVGGYYPDFVFPAAMLIVEIDGGYHNSKPQRSRDSKRSSHLKKLGYQVKRFTNGEVEKCPDRVLLAVSSCLLGRGVYAGLREKVADLKPRNRKKRRREKKQSPEKAAQRKAKRDSRCPRYIQSSFLPKSTTKILELPNQG